MLEVYLQFNEKIISLNKDNGYIPTSFNIDAPSYKFENTSVDGRDGEILATEPTIGPRKVELEIYLKGIDFTDNVLFTDEVLRIFITKKPFYIWSNRMPGKRILVYTDGYKVERITRKITNLKVQMMAFSPYLESIGTTMTPLVFDEDKWQFGQGLMSDDYKYTHTTSKFVIFNAGDIVVDPREHFLKVTFIGVSNNLQIKNLTTGDVFALYGTTKVSDILNLDGIKAELNGSSVFSYTNHQLITLTTGENEFEIINGSGTISFDFKFKYVS